MIKITKIYFKSFDKFLDKYISKSIPHFTLLCMSFIGIFVIIANPLNPYFGTWLYWPIAIILSPLFGIVVYLLGGFAYQLLASICGAKWDPPLSRKIFVYAFAPSYVVGVIASIFYYFVYGTRSFDINTNKYILLAWLIIMFAVSAYVFIHSKRAVKKVLGAKPIRSFIIFLLLPIMLNIVTLGGIAMNAFGYVDSDAVNQIAKEDNNSSVHGLLLENIQNEKLKEAQIKINKGDMNGVEEIYLDIINNQKQAVSSEELMEAYISLSSIYLSAGNAETAINYVNEALKIVEEESEAYFMLKSLLAIEKVDADGLVEIFTKIIEINPNNIEANTGLGRYFLIKNPNYEKALAYNKKAHEIKPTIDGLEMLAVNYYLLESINEAKIHFEELNRVVPSNTTALLKLGEIAYGLGDKKDAIKYFSELKRVDPSKITSQIEEILDEEL